MNVVRGFGLWVQDFAYEASQADNPTLNHEKLNTKNNQKKHEKKKKTWTRPVTLEFVGAKGGASARTLFRAVVAEDSEDGFWVKPGAPDDTLDAGLPGCMGGRNGTGTDDQLIH